MALQAAAHANPDVEFNPDPKLRVLPADIGIALQLAPEPMLRCSKCLRMKEFTCSIGPTSETGFSPMDSACFHPVADMLVYEDPDTGLIQYCCRS